MDSLKNWSTAGRIGIGKVIYNGTSRNINMLANPIDTFVGVACPGAFSELSYFAEQVNESGDIAIQRLRDDGNFHPKFGDVGHELESTSGEIVGVSRFLDNPRISLNLFNQYYDWMSSDKDGQPGDVNVNKFVLIYGNDGFGKDNDDDYIIPVSDEVFIYNNVAIQNKSSKMVFTRHFGMATQKKFKS